jgi:hypothetical protein
MILDSLLKVSAAQQVTADAVSTSSVDLGNVTPKRGVAGGEPMAYVCAITAIGTNTGSTKIQAIQSAAAALTAPQILGEVDLQTADIVAGKVIIVPVGQGIPALRFHGMQHDITGTVDYTVDAYGPMPLSMASIVAERYAKGYTVS